MDQFNALGSVAYRLHMELRNMYFLLLPVFFLASVASVWLEHPAGGPEFIDKIKRAIVATLLLVGFSEITDVMLFLTSGIADKIDNMSGLDGVLQMASEKIHSYTFSPMTPILAFDDLVIAALSYLSYAVLYFARFAMVAVYHFSWVFLTILAPLLLLFHLFSNRITANLFRALFEVASWRVVWSVLSAMLKALPFGTWYAMDGNYLTLAVMNFVIAICMIGTPLVVHALIGNGFSAMAGGLAGAAMGAMLATPAKAMATLKMGRTVLGDTLSFGKGIASKVSGSSSNGLDAGRPPPANPQLPLSIQSPPPPITEGPKNPSNKGDFS